MTFYVLGNNVLRYIMISVFMECLFEKMREGGINISCLVGEKERIN